ncbi:MAG: hypothetical protein ACK56W_07485, partial [Pirellula sp.]
AAIDCGHWRASLVFSVLRTSADGLFDFCELALRQRQNPFELKVEARTGYRYALDAQIFLPM